jgi:hypothetical protein
MDLGESALVRLSLITGAVSGPEYLGVPYSVDVDSEQFNLSGGAVEAGMVTGGPRGAPERDCRGIRAASSVPVISVQPDCVREPDCDGDGIESWVRPGGEDLCPGGSDTPGSHRRAVGEPGADDLRIARAASTGRRYRDQRRREAHLPTLVPSRDLPPQRQISGWGTSNSAGTLELAVALSDSKRGAEIAAVTTHRPSGGTRHSRGTLS